MCSSSMSCWSATEAMQSFSHFEFRKLGVMIENFTLDGPDSGDTSGNGVESLRNRNASAHAKCAR